MRLCCDHHGRSLHYTYRGHEDIEPGAQRRRIIAAANLSLEDAGRQPLQWITDQYTVRIIFSYGYPPVLQANGNPAAVPITAATLYKVYSIVNNSTRHEYQFKVRTFARFPILPFPLIYIFFSSPCLMICAPISGRVCAQPVHHSSLQSSFVRQCRPRGRI